MKRKDKRERENGVYRKRQKTINLYHGTKTSLYLSFTVNHMYKKIVVSPQFHPQELVFIVFICSFSTL